MIADSQARRLTWAVLSFALLFLAGPLAEVAVTVWPPRLGEVNWRFGTAGLLSQGLAVLILGLFLLMFAAALREKAAMVRALSGIAGVLAVVLLVVLVLFTLDALQVRRAVQERFRPTFEVNVAKGMVMYGLGTGVLSLLAVMGWKQRRSSAKSDAFLVGKPR